MARGVYPRRSLAERFWEKVNKAGPTMPNMESPCWVWIGSTFGIGYGHIRIGGERKSLPTHRVAWFMHYGVWPNPFALHRCDNPACVRWEHLFEGDHIANQKDKVAKGRQAKGKLHGRYKTGEHCNG